MRNLARFAPMCLVLIACSPAATDVPRPDETTPTSATTSSSTSTTTLGPGDRDCVRVTGPSGDVVTGAPATDALALAGELFVCADDVVVAPETDLNALAAAAQLAAALGGPLLLPDPRLSAEIGRLKPFRVHIIGEVDVVVPPGTEAVHIGITEAVDATRAALGVSQEVRLPATPDASTIVETVNAIAAGDRVVFPQTSPGSTPPPAPALDAAAVIAGLATASPAPFVWIADAADPVTILTAAGSGHVVDAQIVAIDGTNILAHPEVGAALAGRTDETVRFVGSIPEASEWDMARLRSGVQLPGGGYSILGDTQPKRYVAFYGHPETAALGVLGEQGPQATLDLMAPYITDYAADGHLVVPTFEMLATVAAADPTDGDYSFEWPIDTFTPWIETAAAQGAYVILDLQPGRDDFLTQAKQYEQLLLNPHVGLALDPEWRLGPDQVHLEQVGRVEAAEVNLVLHWLADLVRDNGLPQKMLIVHQFREFMIQDRATIEQRPEIQVVIQMDGQGPIATKDGTWAAITSGTEGSHWSWGWKNFFDEDSPTPSPEHTMGKVPVPVFVSYQ